MSKVWPKCQLYGSSRLSLGKRVDPEGHVETFNTYFSIVLKVET